MLSLLSEGDVHAEADLTSAAVCEGGGRGGGGLRGVSVGSVTSFRVQPLPDFPAICCSTGVPSLLNMINEGG